MSTVGVDEAAGHALRARDVRARYGRRGPQILHGVSLDVPAGRIVGLRGPSGTGKSTLARVMTGLLPPSGGELSVDGMPVPTRRGHLRGDVLMLFQSPRRACSPRASLLQTISEPIACGRRWGRCAVDDPDVVIRACRRVGLTYDLLDRLPGEVSLGQLQRACLARAIVAAPRYLVCDEATAMLDAASAASIAGVVRELADDGVGVLAVSHDLPFLRAWADETRDLAELSGPSSHR